MVSLTIPKTYAWDSQKSRKNLHYRRIIFLVCATWFRFAPNDRMLFARTQAQKNRPMGRLFFYDQILTFVFVMMIKCTALFWTLQKNIGRKIILNHRFFHHVCHTVPACAKKNADHPSL
jgi:hypothetical protein